jgi:hypothetical protein
MVWKFRLDSFHKGPIAASKEQFSYVLSDNFKHTNFI